MGKSLVELLAKKRILEGVSRLVLSNLRNGGQAPVVKRPAALKRPAAVKRPAALASSSSSLRSGQLRAAAEPSTLPLGYLCISALWLLIRPRPPYPVPSTVADLGRLGL